MTATKSSLPVHLFLSLGLIVLVSLSCSKKEEEGGAGDRAAEPADPVKAHDEEPCTVVEPCAEAAASVDPIPADDPRLGSALMIDARPTESFEQWHMPDARNVVYDVLEPTSMNTIEELMAVEKPLVVVYGDGANPDSGEALARELASYGLQNVYFIEGGAPSLQDSQSTASRD